MNLLCGRVDAAVHAAKRRAADVSGNHDTRVGSSLCRFARSGLPRHIAMSASRSITCALVAVSVLASGFSEAARVQQEFSLVGTITDTFILRPSEYVEYASAIAHVRYGATRIPALCPDEEEFDVLQQASVLAALKGDVGHVVELRRYRLECTAGERVPTFDRPLPAIGSEFVLLLYRMGDAVGYGTIPETTFAVQGGRVDTQGFNGLPPVMEIEAFKAALKALMRYQQLVDAVRHVWAVAGGVDQVLTRSRSRRDGRAW